MQVIAKRSDSFPAGEPTFGKADAEPVWLLINDFSICQTPKAEALQLFNGHKLPCLLYYTQARQLPSIIANRLTCQTGYQCAESRRQAPSLASPPGTFHSFRADCMGRARHYVASPKFSASWILEHVRIVSCSLGMQVSALQWGSRQEFKVVPRPVPMAEGHLAFHALCRQPPLQASLVGLHRLSKPTFTPLSQEEGPQPGLILGLDAEFVAFSPPSKALRG